MKYHYGCSSDASCSSFVVDAGRRRALLGALAFSVAAVSLTAMPVGAQEAFPTKPVRIIVGSQAGGGVDTFSRIVAEKLQQLWGQPVVVENRTGASGSIAAEFVARSEPDGHVVVMATPNSHTTGPHVLKFPYDPLKDFTPISLVMEVPSVLVVDAKSGIDSVRALVDLAKAQPDKMNYYSSGVGSIQHLAGEMFKLSADIKMTHVPYKGSAPAIADMLGQHVTTGIDPISATLPYLQAGTVKALAVAGARRASTMPDLPTMEEAGYPGVEMSTWYGLFGPKGMPQEVRDTWQQAIAKIVAIPDVSERMRAVGGEPRGSTPEEFADFVKSENKRMKTLVDTLGIQPG